VIPPLERRRPETAGETAAKDGRRLGAMGFGGIWGEINNLCERNSQWKK